MPAWAALDVREVPHELDEAQEAIAVVAAAVALSHLLTAGAAGCSLRASQYRLASSSQLEERRG